jgi:hypothetical protein
MTPYDPAKDPVPGDNASLQEWIEFARDTYADAPFVAEHLEALAARDGGDYRVGFSTKDFLIYLDGYRFGIETDRAKGASGG